MTRIPPSIRDMLRDKLWQQCDDLGWMSLQDTERARYYELWTRDTSIGGQLAHVMDARKVRVYIKDSLVKPYVRERLSLSEAEVWRLLGLTSADEVNHIYIKPHGRRLEDGRIIGWGRSRDWKSVLMAVFERSRVEESFSSFGVVLLESGRTEADRSRELVKDAAQRLGVAKLAWLEGS
jgi:hypothetical protein